MYTLQTQIINLLILQFLIFWICQNIWCQQITSDITGRAWMRKFKSNTSPLSFYSHKTKVSNLGFLCAHSEPIKWNLTGEIVPLSLIYVGPTGRLPVQSNYIIETEFWFEDIEPEQNIKASMELSCYEEKSLEVGDKVRIYYSNRADETLFLQSSQALEDSKVIPCLTTDPTVAVVLYKNINNSFIVQHYPYNPTQGFSSTETFHGIFKCQQGDLSLIVNATKSQITNLRPLSVKRFTHELIQLECFASETNPARILIDRGSTSNENMNITFVKTQNSYIAQLSYQTNSVGLAGTAICETYSSSNESIESTVLKSWSYEFVVEPILHLDNINLHLACMSKEKNPVLQFFDCRNDLECSLRAPHCFKNLSKCGSETGKVYYASVQRKCDHNGQELNCVHKNYMMMSAYSTFYGIVQCTVEGLGKSWQVFHSLNNKKYTNWREASNQELIRIHNEKSIMFTNTTSEFVCEAVRSLIRYDLKFRLIFKSSLREPWVHDTDSVNISSFVREHTKYTINLNTIAILQIRLPLDAVGIMCYAELWNSTEKLVASTYFVTKHIYSPQSRIDALYSQRIGCPEKSKHRIICEADSYPYPEFTWYYNKTNALDVYSGLKTYTTDNNTGYLEFPEMDFSGRVNYSGEYECVARNDHGNVTLQGFFNFSDPSKSGSQESKKCTQAVSLMIFKCTLIAILRLK